MRYVKAEVRGVPSIQDGRIFLIDPEMWGEGSLIPPIFPSGSITFDEEKKAPEIRLAGENMPAKCPRCATALQHSMLGHNYMWMEMLFVCPKHLDVVWLDISPKANGPETTWDKLNYWPPSETFLSYAKDAPLRFFLTGVWGLKTIDGSPKVKRVGNMFEELTRRA